MMSRVLLFNSAPWVHSWRQAAVAKLAALQAAGGGASTEASGWQGTNLFEAKAIVVTKVQAKFVFFALFLIDGSNERVF